MQITVTIKNVYGNELIYPACDTARGFTDLLATKTLTRRHIEGIKALGYAVIVAQAAPATL